MPLRFESLLKKFLLNNSRVILHIPDVVLQSVIVYIMNVLLIFMARPGKCEDRFVLFQLLGKDKEVTRKALPSLITLGTRLDLPFVTKNT